VQLVIVSAEGVPASGFVSRFMHFDKTSLHFFMQLAILSGVALGMPDAVGAGAAVSAGLVVVAAGAVVAVEGGDAWPWLVAAGWVGAGWLGALRGCAGTGRAGAAAPGDVASGVFSVPVVAVTTGNGSGNGRSSSSSFFPNRQATSNPAARTSREATGVLRDTIRRVLM
jgi:hypothetical protein